MRFKEYLVEEWRPALGCTEPAAIAYAAARAAALARGAVESVHLVCDPRIYKNCYAVGIPYSERKIGIRWALAIGSLLPDPDLELECFRSVDARILEDAGRLIDEGRIAVDVDAAKQQLFIACRVTRAGGSGAAIVEGEHTRIVHMERDGEPLPVDVCDLSDGLSIRAQVAALSFGDLVEIARAIEPGDRDALRRGAEWNLAISRHGLSLFPERFVDMSREDLLTRASRLVCAGVYARMCGENFTVMSLAGSGNKGITCAVPLAYYGREAGFAQERIDEALALACLITSSTTFHLGPLSAVCGCSNAAGIGLSGGIVYLEGGGPEEISAAVTNMVGNVAGMICDGAKIGCAMKTMTAVDAAFRSASLALSGIRIPYSDGIVGRDGAGSLANLGRIAVMGMDAVDRVILSIMQEKMRRECQPGGQP
ncbi:MAG: serine dehydratase subunit alpha family protein [Planctomycetes bacterium]|nr:serine dehydratase subunit alpha family protein [Planctomycetota bacterium]